MGQYYIPVNLSKREYFNPYAGLKLMEHSWCYNNTTNHFMNLMYSSWYGDNIAWVGDYTDDFLFQDMFEDKPSDTNLYIYAEDNFKFVGLNKGWEDRTYSDWGDKYKIIKKIKRMNVFINFDKKLYINLSSMPKTVSYYKNGWGFDTKDYTQEQLDSMVQSKEIVKRESRIFAPSLLLCTSNGRGGGDYRGVYEEDCGLWMGDSVGVLCSKDECKMRIPNWNEFKEFKPRFVEY